MREAVNKHNAAAASPISMLQILTKRCEGHGENQTCYSDIYNEKYRQAENSIHYVYTTCSLRGTTV